MNKIKLIALSLLLGSVSVSCVDILDDNVNPDKAHEITAEKGLPVVVFYAQQMVYDHAEYNIYLSQCLTTGVKSSSGYSYKSEWQFLTMNRHPQWRRHFYDVGVNVNNMIKNASKINSPNYELIGRTIKLLSTQLATDAFGDMPHAQAYQSNSPAYDTQASIYAWMFKEADDLIAMYEDKAITESPRNQKITISEDRVYAGDLSKWKGLVYAVKARLLLRNIPNIDRTPAMCQRIINAADAAINQWKGGSGAPMYGWFGNEPRYNFDGGTNEQNCVWSAKQPKINTWESRDNKLDGSIPSKFFMVDCLGLLNPYDETFSGTYMNREGYANDPRTGLLMLARTGPVSASNPADKVKMRFLENNIGMGTSFKVSQYPNLFFGAYAGSSEAYNPIFTMEELYFIKAEAKYWMGDKVAACELAKEATENNIQRHLERFQKDYPKLIYPGAATVNGPGSETEKNWDSQLVAFLNDEPTLGSKGQTLVEQVSKKGNMRWFFSTANFSLSDLMTQKYISMYMQPEQWSDLRRYHYSNKRNSYGIGDAQEIVYPELRRPYNLHAPYWVDGLSETEKDNLWIQRINYDPETEEKYNSAELQRLGAYQNYKWLQKPMIWAEDYGVRTSLTAE